MQFILPEKIFESFNIIILGIGSMMQPFCFGHRKKKVPFNCPFILWGASRGGMDALVKLIDAGEIVSGFVDSNPSLDKTTLENRPVSRPDTLIKMKGKIRVIITSIHEKEISHSLEEMGYVHLQDYLTMGDYTARYKPMGDYTPELYVNTSLSTLNLIPDVKDACILQIGSGVFLGIEIALILAGARQVVSIDILDIPDYPDITDAKKDYEMFINCLLEKDEFRARYTKGFPGKELSSLFHESDERVCLNRDRITYYHQSADVIPAPDCFFDFVFSNSVMEHLANPPQIIKEIKRVLKPGAMSCHQIDLRDHRDFSKPFDHLYMGRAEWREQQQPHDFCSGNQHRGIEFKQWFEQLNFAVETYLPRKENPGNPLYIEKVHPDFKKFDEDALSTTGCFIKAVKNKS